MLIYFQTRMESFEGVFSGQKNSIQEKLSKGQQETAEHNQQVLERLIEVMRSCISKGSALRGHRDDSIPSIDEDDYINLGNFKEDIRSRAKFDLVLQKHLKKCQTSTYAGYLSKYAQADFVSVFLKELQRSIVTESRNQQGKFIFAVSADEVTDCSNTEQLAIVIRTVQQGGIIRERLIEYIDLENIRGQTVATAIISCLERLGYDIEDCRGQTYDGASNMSGHLNGAQAHIKHIQPKAVFTHCCSHRLNLSLNATSTVQEFRVMMENIKKLGIFFKYSPKRSNILQGILEKADPPISVTKVILQILNRRDVPFIKILLFRNSKISHNNNEAIIQAKSEL